MFYLVYAILLSILFKNNYENIDKRPYSAEEKIENKDLSYVKPRPLSAQEKLAVNIDKSLIYFNTRYIKLSWIADFYSNYFKNKPPTYKLENLKTVRFFNPDIIYIDINTGYSIPFLIFPYTEIRMIQRLYDNVFLDVTIQSYGSMMDKLIEPYFVYSLLDFLTKGVNFYYAKERKFYFYIIENELNKIDGLHDFNDFLKSDKNFLLVEVDILEENLRVIHRILLLYDKKNEIAFFIDTNLSKNTPKSYPFWMRYDKKFKRNFYIHSLLPIKEIKDNSLLSHMYTAETEYRVSNTSYFRAQQPSGFCVVYTYYIVFSIIFNINKFFDKNDFYDIQNLTGSHIKSKQYPFIINFLNYLQNWYYCFICFILKLGFKNFRDSDLTYFKPSLVEIYFDHLSDKNYDKKLNILYNKIAELEKGKNLKQSKNSDKFVELYLKEIKIAPLSYLRGFTNFKKTHFHIKKVDYNDAKKEVEEYRNFPMKRIKRIKLI